MTFQKQPTQPGATVKYLQVLTIKILLCAKKMFCNLIYLSLLCHRILAFFLCEPKTIDEYPAYRKLLIPISIDSPHIWSVFDCKGTCWMQSEVLLLCQPIRDLVFSPVTNEMPGLVMMVEQLSVLISIPGVTRGREWWHVD